MKRAVLRSKGSGAQKGLIKEQEQRKDKRRMVTHRDITQPNEQNLKERLIRFTNSDSPLAGTINDGGGVDRHVADTAMKEGEDGGPPIWRKSQ
jgi:hypothetical protein